MGEKVPRQPRVHVPNAFYHVTARGNNKENVFYSESDYGRYLDYLGEYKERFGFAVLAYALMPNHVHFLLQIGQVPLSHIMQGLQVSYTQYFNRRHERVGHAFQGRYFARIIDSESYLLQAIRYINQNPLRAGLVQDLSAYKWCSHTEMLAKEARLVNREQVLRWFAADPQEAFSRYCRYMSVRVEEEPDWPKVRQAQEKEAAVQHSSGLPGQARRGVMVPFARPALETILVEAARYFELTPDHLQSEERWRDLAAARALFCYLATRGFLYSCREAADLLGKSPTHVWKAARKVAALKEDAAWAEAIARVGERLQQLSLPEEVAVALTEEERK